MTRTKTLKVRSVDWFPNFDAPCSASIARREIRKLRNEHGQTTARSLWKSQRAKNAPMHSSFEWDNVMAADAHRDHQARVLMRCIVVQYEELEEPRQLMVNTRKGESRGYCELQDAVADPDKELVTLKQARSLVSRTKRRIEHIKEAAKLVNEMNGFLIDTV